MQYPEQPNNDMVPQAQYPTPTPIYQQPIPMQPGQAMPQQMYAQPLPGQMAPQYPQQQVPMQQYPGYAPMPQPMYQQPAQPIVIAPVFNNQVSQVNAGFMVAPPKPTLGMPIRILYFLFFGVAFGFFWIFAALCFCCSIIGLPIGIWMFNRTSKAFFLW